MAAKSKRSLLKPAIIVLAGLLVFAGLFVWISSSKKSAKSAVIPNASTTPTPYSSSSKASPPAPNGLGSLPQAPQGAASQGAAAQPTSAPGTPVESTTQGTSGQSSAIGPNDSNTTYCSFTPGTICTVRFSLEGGNKTVQLDSKTIPSGGTATWLNWTPASIGITPGAWEVTAIVTVNGKQVSSQPEVMYVHS